MLERYPDDQPRSPWASTPIIEEAVGPFIALLMSPSSAEEVSAYAAELAREHGLVCFDPQSGTLR